VCGERVREIGDGEFAGVVLAADGPVLVEFFGTWCGACRRLAPVLDRVAGEVAGRVQVVKVNVDDNPDVVGRFAVSSTPTLVLFVSGRPVARVVGAQQEEPLRAWLDEAVNRQPSVGEAVGLSWAPVDACTLPTAQQPLRVAEFGELFAGSLRGVDRVSATRLRLELKASAEAAARDLAARESDCCGFFSFTFTPAGAATVGLEVEVPANRAEVLDGLAAQASAARAA
jgi:thioredoxin